MKLGLQDESFDRLYEAAGKMDAEGNVSVDSFLQTLKSS
jgi:hypothetical protein